MRFLVLLPVLMAFLPAASAQQQQDPKLMDRVMAKPDMSLRNSMDGKKFNGGGSFDTSRHAEVASYNFDQKTFGSKTASVRSFFGIKNPWIGKKVEVSQASLWSKTIVENADRKFDVNSSQVKPFYQGDKSAEHRETPVKTGGYSIAPSAKGAVSQMAPQLNKNLTVDDVREILNKNH